MSQNMKKISDAVIIGTLAASAQAATPSDNVMHMTKEHIRAVCSQDPNGLGLEIADGTKICEVSFDNGKTWILLSAAVVASLALIGG